jgi:hypothetical protein
MIKKKLHVKFYANDDACRGFGRYFFEHWIHSHPSVSPCDLYPGKEYKWNYASIPTGEFVKEIKMAPRFNIQMYKGRICKFTNNEHTENLLWNYEKLYNINASTIAKDEEWWGWKVLNVKVRLEGY